MPPFVLAALGLIGAAAGVRLLAREARRVNAALDPHRAPPSPDDRGERLVKDPSTGTYRPRERV